MTRDTVAVETPASWATSLRVQDTMFSPGSTPTPRQIPNGVRLFLGPVWAHPLRTVGILSSLLEPASVDSCRSRPFE
jgi:hypothetical protein